MNMYTEDQILKAAIAAYEANRAFYSALGDKTLVPWEWAESQTKARYILNVHATTKGDELYVIPAVSQEERSKSFIFAAVVSSVLACLMDKEETLPGV